MFNNCTHLKNFNLSYLNLRNLTDISHMFGNCKALKGVTCYWDTRNIQNISYLFSGCFTYNKWNK